MSAPFGPPRPPSPQSITQTRTPRLNAPPLERLACLFLNQLQTPLTPFEDEILFDIDVQPKKMVCARIFGADFDVVRQYNLDTIPAIADVTMTITLAKLPAFEDGYPVMVHEVEARIFCCDAVPFRPIGLGPATNSPQPCILSRELLDGRFELYGLHVTLRLSDYGARGSNYRDLSRTSWDGILRWLKKLSKKHFNSFGEVRSLEEMERWDGIQNVMEPW